MKPRIRLVQRKTTSTRQRFKFRLGTIHIYIAGGLISTASIFILLLTNISSPEDTRAAENANPGGFVSRNTENIKYENFKLLSNSFNDVISARYTSDKRQDISMKLVTMKGTVVLFENFTVKAGDNFLRCEVPASVPKETYILFVENKDSVLATGVVACNQ